MIIVSNWQGQHQKLKYVLFGFHVQNIIRIQNWIW